MATTKQVLCRDRLRHVPPAFSWIDHRFVRNGHISRCTHEALALYLFLVTVADAEGLSYYSDAKTAQLLNMDEPTVCSARRELRHADLIAYRHPLYQVLSLDDAHAGMQGRNGEHCGLKTHEAVSIGEVLRHAIGGAA